MTRIYYRFPEDPDARPDQYTDTQDWDVQHVRREIHDGGAIITTEESIGWRQQLANMENPEL